jgi:hypothetical protein
MENNTVSEDIQVVSLADAKDAYAEFVREMRLGFHDPVSFNDFCREYGLRVEIDNGR